MNIKITSAETWQYQELICWFVQSCRDMTPAAHAAGLLQRYFNFNKLHPKVSAVDVLAA